jgi:hypothetical protein
MKTTPIIGLEAMLDLPFLPALVKKGQTQYDQHHLSDRMPLRHDFGVSFEVIIPEREDWDKQLFILRTAPGNIAKLVLESMVRLSGTSKVYLDTYQLPS